MSNSNLHKRRGFSILNIRTQNVSIETWIKAAKFN